jgi:hypothetical protein
VHPVDGEVAPLLLGPADELAAQLGSLMLESPTITCRRRNRSASACGSSLVLMIGPDLVVAEPADDLPGDQERDPDVGQPTELAVSADQVVLVAAVELPAESMLSLKRYISPASPPREAAGRRPRAGLPRSAPRLVVRDQP